MSTGTGGGGAPWVWAAVVVGGVALGGAGLFFKDALLGVPDVAPAAVGVAEGPQAAEAVPSSASAPAPAPEPEARAPAVSTAAPRFDVVRVEPDGRTLIAGRAAPNAPVTVLAGAAIIAEGAAGADGSFALFADVPPSDAPQVLQLESGEAVAEASVIVAPIAQESGAQAAVLLNTEAGVKVLQAPTAEAADASAAASGGATALSDLALDAISYSEAGDVKLAGRAARGGFVRIYLDDRPLTTKPVADDGSWRTALPDVDKGVYTLRVDQLAADGSVKARVETPFKRAAQETVEAAQSAEAAQIVTVQPGATLWAIARERYGEGQLYVQVFEANRDRIRNPDLIYPGQVFDIPE